ncbi:MAG: nitroreductase family protein [Clostridia bacterium]|nr:nitroreductase family protein [Clostridia bacterium]
MNETIRLLMERKSVRQFVMEEMPAEDIRTILEAAVQAPTAGNKSLWTAIHVTDPEKKLALSKSCDNQPFIATAPLVLVFCADYKRWFDMYKTLDLGEELRVPGEGDFLLAAADTIIAAHASVVAADALGYGSCYIGDIVENCDIQREILGLPEYVKPVCMAVYGKPTQNQIDRKKPPRFKVEDLVHENAYREIDAQQMVDMLGERQGLEGEALDRWLLAFCKRKWNCDFSREMTRSAAQMIREWCEGK